MSRTKQMEDQMIETVTNRKADLEDILQKANFIIDTIKEDKETVQLKNNEIVQLRENYLKTHEDDVQGIYSKILLKVCKYEHSTPCQNK